MSWPATGGIVAAADGGRDPLMDRRAFIGSLALGSLAVSRAASAQPARKVSRVGILSLGMTSDQVGPEPRNPPTNALLRGLRDLGYVYGEQFVTEARGADGRPERFPTLAAELVRLRVDVIVAPGPMLSALKRAASTIPIVMAGALDPVGQGLVKSLGQPGGNFTGLSLQSAETAAKRLELLKELVPTAALVAVVWERTVLVHWQAAEAGRPGAGVEGVAGRGSRRWRDRRGRQSSDRRAGRRSPCARGRDPLPAIPAHRRAGH